MMPLKKFSKLSSKFTNKKNRRKNRNRLLKLARVLMPLSIILSLLSLVLIIFLIKNMPGSFLINPVTMPFSKGSINDDKYISELEKSLQRQKISYSSIDKLSNSISIKLSNSSEVIISTQKDLNTQINSLQYILSQLTMKGKDFTRLDLRFDKPVIVLR